jgi:hypothetical protein
MPGPQRVRGSVVAAPQLEVEIAADGPCPPIHDGSRRTNGRSSTLAAIVEAALPQGNDEFERPKSSHDIVEEPVTTVQREQAKQRAVITLLQDNPSHTALIHSVLAFGKHRPGQQQGLGQEQLAQAIVSGLHEPVAAIPLGLGKDLDVCVTMGGQLFDKVHAELLSSGVDPEAAKIAAAAINNDNMLLQAAKASREWKLGPGPVTSVAWREAIRRAGIWFVEVEVYRLLAKHGIRPPNFTGPPAVLAKLPFLGPASIQEGMPGHITAAEHLASVLACTGTAFLPFGKHADLMSTCRSSNARSMVASVAGRFIL